MLRFLLTRFRSTWTVMVLSDLCALFLSLCIAYFLRDASGGFLSSLVYWNLAPSVLLFLLIYGICGLYPGILRPPSEEMKWLTIGSSLGFLFLSFFIFLAQEGQTYSRLVIFFAWLFSLILVPLFRYCARAYFSRKIWWGYPVILFAGEQEIPEALLQFQAHREQGLYIVDTILLDENNPFPAVAVLKRLKRQHHHPIAFVSADNLPKERREESVLTLSKYFRRVIVKLDSLWIKQSTLRVASVPGGLVLSMKQNLLDPNRMRMKRFMDLFLCACGSVALLILFPLLAVCIRLDSKGPVFFRQKRIGRGGREINVFKFRTMVANAPEVLKKTLAENPELKKEWRETQKLMNDPRLTRVGRFLRHTSLDELPQIFNVLKGEMSLVGPRPIVKNEIVRYGDAFDMYIRVRPGITGLWQVSGRNDVGYAKRVALDQEYVYNWSIWMDIYIILRTVPAMLSGRGAY